MGSSSSSDSVTSSRQRRLTRTYLPDDFWYEILLHLPVVSIFKFRCVSKVWLSILSSPNFINHWYKLNNSLWALVHVRGTTLKRLKVKLSHLELNSQFISHHQSGFSFRFLKLEHDLTKTTCFQSGLLIIGSSNGLVLCTNDYLVQKTYYVCNPLTKRWVSLPPPPTSRFCVVAGLACEEVPCSSSLVSTGFKVIRVPMFLGEITFKVEIFSSDLGEWNAYDVVCPPNTKWKISLGDNLVTHNGVFYWMQKRKNKILIFSVKENNKNRICGSECNSINLPDQAMDGEDKHASHFLGESEGLICYAIVKHEERSLCVWVLEKDWYMLHKDTKFYDVLAQMESSLIGESAIAVLGFNPFDKNVVIIGYKKYIWAYNIRSGGYEQLSEASFLGSRISAPHVGLLTFPLKLWPTMLPPVVS